MMGTGRAGQWRLIARRPAQSARNAISDRLPRSGRLALLLLQPLLLLLQALLLLLKPLQLLLHPLLILSALLLLKLLLNLALLLLVLPLLLLLLAPLFLDLLSVRCHQSCSFRFLVLSHRWGGCHRTAAAMLPRSCDLAGPASGSIRSRPLPCQQSHTLPVFVG
jgi:hypothetical protein